MSVAFAKCTKTSKLPSTTQSSTIESEISIVGSASTTTGSLTIQP